ncbi:MAG: AAA family ATPase [Candidatus Phytoplasma sp. TWB_XP]
MTYSFQVCHFISCVGSDFNSRKIGAGSEAIKKMFEEANQYQNCIIFIDEIDAFIAQRSDRDTDSAIDSKCYCNYFFRSSRRY